jgi:hypothetical protein
LDIKGLLLQSYGLRLLVQAADFLCMSDLSAEPKAVLSGSPITVSLGYKKEIVPCFSPLFAACYHVYES